MGEAGVHTVLLVDDHDLIRQGLARAFERATDFTVAGEAGSVTDHPSRRIPATGIRCDSDRRLLPPIPASRGLAPLNSRR